MKYKSPYVLKISNCIRVPVHEICADNGWHGKVNGYRIRFEHKTAGIVLFVNEQEQPNIFIVSEDRIQGTLRNGAKFRDKRSRYYVVDNKTRYAHIYIKPTETGFSLGTRVGLEPRPRYDSSLLGHKAFRIAKQCRDLRLSRKRKNKIKSADKRRNAVMTAEHDFQGLANRLSQWTGKKPAPQPD
jgi:hypothetical protein